MSNLRESFCQTWRPSADVAVAAAAAAAVCVGCDVGGNLGPEATADVE